MLLASLHVNLSNHSLHNYDISYHIIKKRAIILAILRAQSACVCVYYLLCVLSLDLPVSSRSINSGMQPTLHL